MLSAIDVRKMDFFDLFYVLAKPCMVHFVYDNKEYAIESHVEGTGISVESLVQICPSIHHESRTGWAAVAYIAKRNKNDSLSGGFAQ